ncbi:hypothetical protein [Heyndrickxia sporothermodurans]|uniref:hypothetical protein n=1 Tax=Heyndrickxia sporothermodurans TaxID=46224 RepID=UPI000D36DE78|nr:hypothetical protein [Heyndrickxia sporothermodurans]PTY75761.1 hypothetical protein B5V89_19745 [Heyndrickxia sporothermodurans]
MKKNFKIALGIFAAFFIIVIIALVVDISNDDEQKEKTEAAVANLKKENKKDKEKSVSIGANAVSALESNNFLKFVEEYKKLGKDKTLVWDNQLFKKKVTWSGTVVRAGTSQLFVYGGQDYKNESWSQLGDSKKLFYTFTAKYKDKNQFNNLKPGDKVTVQGSLESRGDYNLNFNWKIYDAILKEN